MGECLDCMEELQKNRCTVDVTNFDYKWYWQVRRFWEQVDIRGEDECWPWLGTTRKNKYRIHRLLPLPVPQRQNSVCLQGCILVEPWLYRKVQNFQQKGMFTVLL